MNDGPDPTGSLVFFRDRFGDVLIQQQCDAQSGWRDLPALFCDAQSGWRDLPALFSVALSERISSGVGEARGHTVRIRGVRADVWSPHTVLGRGMPCRRIVASSHGLGCEHGCRNQHGRHEAHFGHFVSPYGGRSQGSAQLLVAKSGQPLEIFHHVLSTKRELLWSRRVTAAAMIAGEYVTRNHKCRTARRNK